MLKDLEDTKYGIHVVQVGSGLGEIYVEDTLRGVAGCRSSDSVFRVATAEDVSMIGDAVYLQPIDGGKWFIIVEAVKSARIGKELEELIREGSSRGSCIFLLKTTKYSVYKKLRSTFPSANSVYLDRIGYRDCEYLMSGRIPDRLIRYVYYGYRNSVEKIFKLYRAVVDSGVRVSGERDITEVCGKTDGSIIDFVLRLLEESGVRRGERGARTVYRKRVGYLGEILAGMGVGMLQYTVRRVVADIYDIKVLYLEGKIYQKEIDVPTNGYSEKKLSGYRNFFSRIVRVGLGDIVRFRRLLDDSEWVDSIDAVGFVYNYIEGGKCI